MDAVKSISYIFDDLNKMTFNDSSKETLFIKIYYYNKIYENQFIFDDLKQRFEEGNDINELKNVIIQLLDQKKYEIDEKNKQLILNCPSKKVSLDLNEDEKSENKDDNKQKSMNETKKSENTEKNKDQEQLIKESKIIYIK